MRIGRFSQMFLLLVVSGWGTELYGLLLKSQWMHLYYNSLLKLPLKVQLLTLKVSL